MTQDQKPNFREKAEGIALNVPASWPTDQAWKMRVDYIEKHLTEAHDLGVERTAKEYEYFLEAVRLIRPEEIRGLKLGKGE